MKNQIILTAIAILFVNLSFSQSVGFKIYNAKGKEVTLEDMAEKMAKYDVVLLGELHNDPIAHWVQLKTTKLIGESGKEMVLGAEMFEADNQLLLDEYTSGLIKTSNFEKEARLWPNYKTDYKPLVEYAKENDLQFVATNVPRRYASYVVKNGLEGLETLNDEAKSYIADLPILFDTLTPGYAEMMQMGMGHGMGIDPLNMVKAQAIKDATMSQNILTNLPKKGIFIHYQGDYHSANKGGIYWYIQKTDAKKDVVALSTVSAENLDWDASYAGRAEFILVVDEDMTKTY